MKSVITLLFLLPLKSIFAQDSLHMIRLDQEGFYPKAEKIAVLVIPRTKDSLCNASFFIIRANTKDTVYRGESGGVLYSSNSSLRTRILNFSSFNQPGIYRLTIPECAVSRPFQIAPKVHHQVAVASLKAFYYQRASMPLESRYAGKWSRAAGHPDDSVIIHPSAASSNRKAGSAISTPRGWYDAGDYNKYIVNSGISMGTLLSAYEDFKMYFDTLKTNIPAIERPIPDILNEILYNLRWMLSMQDPEDGGVYNKCTNASFDPMIMPAAAHATRYVVQKGTAATLDFAAVAAQASRIFTDYQKQLPGLGDSCLQAAENAWAWANLHPDLAYDQTAMNKQYEPKILTGGYGDRKFSDEWFWAACELFTTTGKKTYFDTLEKKLDLPYSLPSWGETELLGYYTLVKENRYSVSDSIKTILRDRMIQKADEYLDAARFNAFLTVMGGRKSDFVWGSNANAANQGILLIRVYALTGNRRYLEAALTNLEYLCGRNATGYCFVTGMGSFSTKHPHHRPSVADGIADPIPGLMAGGPNPGEQDHCHYDYHEAETAYVDSDCAYASNEIAINWNAPLVYLANAVEALY